MRRLISKSKVDFCLTLTVLFTLLIFAHEFFGEPNLPAADVQKSKYVYRQTGGAISGSPAPKLNSPDYPKLNLPYSLNDSRNIIGILAQQHLYFASLFLGGLYWIVMLELFNLTAKKPEDFSFYNRFAHEILELIIPLFSIVGFLGLFLLIGLLTFYSKLTRYLISLFNPFVVLYGFLFFLLTLFLYFFCFTWNRIEKPFLRWSCASLGIWTALIGTAIMMISNSWNTFMMSPAGNDYRGYFLTFYQEIYLSTI